VSDRKRVGDHPRNTSPMLASPRCGARTRAGEPCRSPAANGKARCRMHGGAIRTGAPMGNSNALKHGFYTREVIAEHRAIRKLIREMDASLREFEEGT
jgi:hypothetical protein